MSEKQREKTDEQPYYVTVDVEIGKRGKQEPYFQEKYAQNFSDKGPSIICTQRLPIRVAQAIQDAMEPLGTAHLQLLGYTVDDDGNLVPPAS